MTVTKKDVEHIAELSRINLSEQEKEQMQKHLSRMVKHFEMLDSVDISSVPPTAHILSSVNVLRPDKAAMPTDRNELLKNAPVQDGECYIVPRVLE